MAEPTQIVFSYKEVVESLLKKHQIHEGLWAIYIRFGIQAANIVAENDDVRPSAIIPVLEIGIQKADKETNISVDAALVNPRPQSISKPRAKLKGERKKG